MSRVFMTLSLVSSLSLGAVVGGTATHLMLTTTTTCVVERLAPPPEAPSALFNSQPVPLTGYKSY